MIKLIAHAGAWNPKNTDIIEAERLAVEQAAIKITSGTSSVVDVVEKVVIELENNPLLDAGFGSIIQLDGHIRMDAGIADFTSSLGKVRYGAVLEIEHVCNPVSVARKLLEYGYHCILSGEGANRFALENRFPYQMPVTIKARMQDYMNNLDQINYELKYSLLAERREEFEPDRMSTVGAVAVNEYGDLAVANSTGGLYFGYPGRVADTAIFGAGLYCSNKVAVACTGNGEPIIRSLLARRVEDYFIKTKRLQEAVEQAMLDFEHLNEGNAQGGLIAVANDGQTAIGYNTISLATHVLHLQ